MVRGVRTDGQSALDLLGSSAGAGQTRRPLVAPFQTARYTAFCSCGFDPLRARVSLSMKVLVVGKGGREHALCWRLHQSQTVGKLYCASGNPGINQLAELVPISPMDIPALVTFARDKAVDLVVVGPDDPLGAGLVDELQKAGTKVFGPTRAAAR